jgi:3-oxoadipate enol-lactonase
METPRGRMAWLEAGTGWPVILLHGFPLNADMWRPQLERVPIGWRYLAPDLRGFGQTGAGGSSVSVDDWASDVFALMDCLEMDDAVIGGLSLGGYVSFAMYRQAGARFNGMVLANTRSQADSEQARAGRIQLRRLLAEQGLSAVAPQLLPKLFSSAADPGAVAFARDLIEAAAPEAIDAAIGALLNRPDSTPDLANITCGALVIASDQDAIVPLAEAEAMQRALTRSQLTVIGGAGHMSNLEQPDAFSRALEDFLRSAL